MCVVVVVVLKNELRSFVLASLFSISVSLTVFSR